MPTFLSSMSFLLSCLDFWCSSQFNDCCKSLPSTLTPNTYFLQTYFLLYGPLHMLQLKFITVYATQRLFPLKPITIEYGKSENLSHNIAIISITKPSMNSTYFHQFATTILNTFNLFERNRNLLVFKIIAVRHRLFI